MSAHLMRGLVVPDLDRLDVAELILLASLFARLSAFCSLRQKSILARLEGRAADAILLERAADSIRARLPLEIQWS